MKRTKESFTRYHPGSEQMEGISGVKELEGEDLSYEARTKHFKQQQKEWLEQQIAEKKWKQEQERLEEEAYAKQTQELTRMRGMLEDDFNRKKAEQRQSMKNTNNDFAKSKMDDQKAKKQEQLQYEVDEMSKSKQNGQKRPFEGIQ